MALALGLPIDGDATPECPDCGRAMPWPPPGEAVVRPCEQRAASRPLPDTLPAPARTATVLLDGHCAAVALEDGNASVLVAHVVDALRVGAEHWDTGPSTAWVTGTDRPLLYAEALEETASREGYVASLLNPPPAVYHAASDCGHVLTWDEWRALPAVCCEPAPGVFVPTRTCPLCRSTVSAAQLMPLTSNGD